MRRGTYLKAEDIPVMLVLTEKLRVPFEFIIHFREAMLSNRPEGNFVVLKVL